MTACQVLSTFCETSPGKSREIFTRNAFCRSLIETVTLDQAIVPFCRPAGSIGFKCFHQLQSGLSALKNWEGTLGCPWVEWKHRRFLNHQPLFDPFAISCRISLNPVLTARLLFYFHLKTHPFFIFLNADRQVAKITKCDRSQEMFTRLEFKE